MSFVWENQWENAELKGSVAPVGDLETSDLGAFGHYYHIIHTCLPS